jgi:16S rRNA (guanine527-N7)-methyltransferase
MAGATIEQHIGALAAILRELQVQTSALSPILAHAEAVAADADRLGLVSPADQEHVLTRHSADSLLFALARVPEPGERWVDVGSGAGFPGIPLACCYPETTFVLVEPQQRRAGFLELQVARLDLTNVSVEVARASTLSPGFDVATARALAEPALAMEVLLRLVEPHGSALVAAGSGAAAPHGATEFDVSRPGVDSPGRVFMISSAAGRA